MYLSNEYFQRSLFFKIFLYQTFQSDCSWASSNLQIPIFTKMSITEFLHKINTNQSQKKFYSLIYPNIQNLHGFQAVHGRTRPGTNTKTEKPIKISTQNITKFLSKCTLPFLHALIRPYIHFCRFFYVGYNFQTTL